MCTLLVLPEAIWDGRMVLRTGEDSSPSGLGFVFPEKEIIMGAHRLGGVGMRLMASGRVLRFSLERVPPAWAELRSASVGQSCHFSLVDGGHVLVQKRTVSSMW